MDEYESLSHTKWECKYHVVFIPKCRRKTLYGQLREHLGEVFRKLAAQKESRIEEGHLLPDHVHMMIAIPPKYAVPISRRCAPGQLAMDCKCLPSERWRIELLRHAFPLEPETNARFEPPLSASSVKGANKRGRSETERLTNLRRD